MILMKENEENQDPIGIKEGFVSVQVEASCMHVALLKPKRILSLTSIMFFRTVPMVEIIFLYRMRQIPLKQ